MKVSPILLALLLILCVALPYIFNVKYHEKFTSYPSKTDLPLTNYKTGNVSFSDISFSDVSFVDVSFSEGMTNLLDNSKENINSYNNDAYSTYDESRKKGYSISDYFIKNPSTDEFANRLENDLTVVSFLNNMNQKETYTATRKLRDEETKEIYELSPNDNLYNNNGGLKVNKNTKPSKIKCLADNGTKLGGPVCCGQEGTVNDNSYICPIERPKCYGYKCGSNFGTCR